MSLPKEIGSHHTMWFTVGDHKPVAVRYAVDNDEVVCFGDNGLTDLIEGSTIAGLCTISPADRPCFKRRSTSGYWSPLTSPSARSAR